MTTTFCGIDPGITGALGFVDQDRQFVDVVDMPILPTTRGRKQVDFNALAGIVRDHGAQLTVVEEASTRPGEGAVGAFSYGATYGGIMGVLAACKLQHGTIRPATWKRSAGIPPRSDKRASILIAQRMLPDAAQHLSRVKDHGRAEALLLALQACGMWGVNG